MMIFFGVFIGVSIALCPLAWILGIIDKLKTMGQT